MCGGDCWEIKEKIGGKKISGGQKFWGGNFWGKCKKRGGKTFLGECWGSCDPQQILGGEFLEKCQRQNLGGKFCGVVRRGVRCGRNGA